MKRAGRLHRWVLVGVLLAASQMAGDGALASLRVGPLVLEAPPGCPARLGPVEVTNVADGPVQARVEVVGLTHDLEGFPVFLDDAAARASARALLRPDWEDAALAPGERRELWLEVTGCPDEGAYAAALISAPVLTGTLKVGVLVLLHGPEAWPSAPVVLEGVWAQQEAAGQPIEVVARVRNPGAVGTMARVEALIVGPDGETRQRLWLGPGRLLPGASRLLRASWQPPLLPPGRYTIEARLHPDGSPDPVPKVARFDVIGPYQVAMVRGGLSLALSSEASPPSLVASVHNRGAVTVRPQLAVTFARDDEPVASQRLSGAQVGPGEVGGVEVPWPAHLPPGTYRVEVVWLDGDRPVAAQDVEVTFGAALASHPGERSAP
ncbi:hypothetical protein [Geochorda subterranea]|uniref:CARDB protein n=1 Tax=Geochorda subterranea TaxID=3109564 RepID=A0ABZ1BMF6_9FIRM|nr:hypothetical protein [Limnochorda sp. LNt]WRP14004.1 hypothetical protein VLY81_11305 [Limnochorda sp. LNt]